MSLLKYKSSSCVLPHHNGTNWISWLRSYRLCGKLHNFNARSISSIRNHNCQLQLPVRSLRGSGRCCGVIKQRKLSVLHPPATRREFSTATHNREAQANQKLIEEFDYRLQRRDKEEAQPTDEGGLFGVSGLVSPAAWLNHTRKVKAKVGQHIDQLNLLTKQNKR